MLERILQRLKAACRTNNVQLSAVCLLTASSGLAAITANRELDFAKALCICLFWPVLAFVFNLIDPIP